MKCFFLSCRYAVAKQIISARSDRSMHNLFVCTFRRQCSVRHHSSTLLIPSCIWKPLRRYKTACLDGECAADVRHRLVDAKFSASARSRWSDKSGTWSYANIHSAHSQAVSHGQYWLSRAIFNLTSFTRSLIYIWLKSRPPSVHNAVERWRGKGSDVWRPLVSFKRIYQRPAWSCL